MQAVILAAGKSTRTYPLTLTKPKPLLKAANKSIIEWDIDAVKDITNEIIIVTGYKKEMLEKFVSQKYPKLDIKFIQQKEQLGTGNALLTIKNFIKNEFILLMGDNIYSKADANKIIKHRCSILVKNVKNPENFGVIIEKNNFLLDIIEKPENYVSSLINCALYSLDKNIFDVLKTIKKSARNEYELTDALKITAKSKVRCVKSVLWLPITYPWDLLIADRKLRKLMGKSNLIGQNSMINGNVKSSSVGNNCIIDGDVKNSIIMDNAIVSNKSVIEDSIIGENVNFSGTIKSSSAYSTIKGKKIFAGKIGAVIGDNAKADNVEIKPGCKIWPNKIVKGKIQNDIE
ncbi:NTP transferase domain-containing protein [Candidatus Woesearchaeota archaeon]|nr:NTP transferase domain-containing protein [Candidatus Woesearchaeota archaeon]